MRAADRSSRSRFGMVLVSLIAMGTGRASAGDDLTVLRPDESPRTMLYRALEHQAREKLDARRAEVAALKTPEAVRSREERIRGRFLGALGDFPEKTPLNARVVGADRRDGYRVERVIYESRPGHHVTANFYLPDGPPPFPGVLIPCGHSAEGKAAESYQRLCILLARNGLAALCYDPIGQGERIQLLDEKGKPTVGGNTTEHTMAGIGALLVGRSTASYRVWDGIRSLDYLAGRPEVDPARLGCAGNSGGGTLTAYLMALDDRIAAAVPSCYITSLERLFATLGPQDAEQNITGQVDFGMDHGDYVLLRAPKPTLLCVGTQDFFDIQGSWDTFREVKRVYGVFGFGERVELFESDEPHGLTRPRREATLRWLRRWLVRADDAPVEAEASVAKEAQLRVTRSGQVLLDHPGSKSVFDFTAERAEALQKQRAARSAGRTPKALRAEIRTRLALPRGRDVHVDHRDTVRRDGYTIDRWALATEPGVTVPVLVFRPGVAEDGKPVVVYVGAERVSAAPGGPIEKRVKAGEIVALVEPRGMGEATPGEPNPSRHGPFGPDWKEAFLGLHLNRPLLGQRVFDLLQALNALDGDDGFHLVGFGTAGPVALHAAALDDRVKSVAVVGGLVSWSALARATVSRDQLSSVVPGVLESYDLPDVAALIAPRALALRGAVDPAGRPVAQEQLDATYTAAKDAYSAQKADDALILEAGTPPP